MSIYPGFGTDEMERVFSAESLAGALLRFESGLALALADTGIANRAEADAVAAACAEPLADPEAVLASTWREGTPMIAVIDQIKSRLDGSEARWVHHGATTQDALDTAHMLLAREALALLERDLSKVASQMRDLVVEHRDLAQMGRTFLQHARPTTFGFRVAMWLAPTLRHLSGLRHTRSRLVVQLGGPVGTGAAYGSAAVDVTTALAHRLGLGAPDISWHTDRTRVWEIVDTVTGMAGTMAKVASDIALLAQSEIGELRVRAGGSSSMEGKRNPIDAIRAAAAARVCVGVAGTIDRADPHHLDRGVGGWHAEWVGLPLVFQTAAAAAAAMVDCLSELEVDAQRMTSLVDAESAVELGKIDQRPIDSVLAEHERLMGETT